MSKKGVVKISTDVLLNIIGLAALDVEGVARVNNFHFINDDKNKLKYNNKGIALKIEDNKMMVSLSIDIEEGYKIPDVCSKVQENIFKEVYNMTNLCLDEINIEVADIAQ